MKIQKAKDEQEKKIKEEEEKKKAEEEKKKKEEEDKKLQKVKEEEDKKKKEEEDRIKIKKSEEDALRRKQELEEKRKLQREEERLKKEEERKKKEEEEKKQPKKEESKPSEEVQESPKEAPGSVLKQSKGSVKDKLVVFAEESKKSGETHTAVSKGPVSKAGPSIKDRQAAVAASLAAAVAPKETSSPKESVIPKTRGASISDKISQIKQEQAKDAAEPAKKGVTTRKMSVPASFETQTPPESPGESSNEISPRLEIPKRAMGPSGRRPKSTHVKSELDTEDAETVE